MISAKLKIIQGEFEVSELTLETKEKENGYLSIEFQDKEFNRLMSIIKHYDCDKILETFYFQYQYEFPAVFNGMMVNNYEDLAKALIKAMVRK